LSKAHVILEQAVGIFMTMMVAEVVVMTLEDMARFRVHIVVLDQAHTIDHQAMTDIAYVSIIAITKRVILETNANIHTIDWLSVQSFGFTCCGCLCCFSVTSAS
jgi:hypothetical protein